MDRKAWQGTVHEIAKEWDTTWQLSNNRNDNINYLQECETTETLRHSAENANCKYIRNLFGLYERKSPRNTFPFDSFT